MDAPVDAVPVHRERRQVPRERDGVAGHVDHRSGIEPRDPLDDLATGAGARRIEDDDTAGDPLPLSLRGVRAQSGDVAVDPRRLRARTDPLGQILPRMLRRARVALDADDPGGCAADVGQCRGEQPHPSVEVEVNGIRVQLSRRRADTVGDRLGESSRRQAVDLPEAARVDAEDAVAHALLDDLDRPGRGSSVGAREDADPPVGGLHEVDPARSGAAQIGGRAGDRVRRERKIGRLDHAVRPRGERAHTPVLVDVQAHTRPPTRAVGRLVVPGRPDRHGEFESTDAFEGLSDHPLLQQPLLTELDVAELRTADAFVGRTVDRGRRPHVRATLGRGIQDLQGLGAPERLLPRVGETDAHPLARQGVRDEDHAALVAPDEDAAVGDSGDVEIDEVAVLHPPSLSYDDPPRPRRR